MATRFYLPSTGSSAFKVSGYASSYPTFRAVTTPISSEMLEIEYTTRFLGGPLLNSLPLRNYVSDELSATITVTLSQAKCQFMGRRTSNHISEYAKLTAWIGICNSSLSYRGSIIAFRTSDVSTIQYQNRDTSTTTRTGSIIIAFPGDRVTAELWHTTNMVNADITVKALVGDNAVGDLPEDNSATATSNAWIEFPATMSFREAAYVNALAADLTYAGTVLSITKSSEPIPTVGELSYTCSTPTIEIEKNSWISPAAVSTTWTPLIGG